MRTYVAVDGGMSDNPRPALYGSDYETFLPRAVAAERTRVVRLVGKHCESGDVLVRDAQRPGGPAPSATSSPPRSPAPTATRWGRTTTASPGPPVVFVADGQARLVVRRETMADLARHRLRAGSTGERRREPAQQTSRSVRPSLGDREPDRYAAAVDARQARRCWAAASSARPSPSWSPPGPTPSPPGPGSGSRSPGSRSARPSRARAVALRAGRAHPRRRRGRRRPRRRRGRRGHRGHRAGPAPDRRRAQVRQAGRHRQQGAAGQRRRRAVRRRRRRPASTCCSRRRWRAASRSSGRCASRWSASRSTG